jgi:glycosyltransferase involved in cell wall biosynthesis
VDTTRFSPAEGRTIGRRPRLLYVGRVAVEKNLEAFLELPVSADKVVVGDGPARRELMARFPTARWRGLLKGAALVAEYRAADAFVFPSRTDTFGLVMLEAMSCGTPVAAYPVTGPRDVVREHVNGALSEDLGTAVQRALSVDRASCRRFALQHGWQQIARRLIDARADARPAVAPPGQRPDNAASWPQPTR